MSNPTFTTAAAGSPPPDPSKHVNYTQGMVLGVDDFQQEFAYLSNRDQWALRDAIGYGTVCGLHVTLDPADHSSISVSPGVAINPRGQLIRVAPRQCAQLQAWLGLQTTIDEMAKLGIGAGGKFTAYIVLCYRDCPADELPVPGEPCRCDSTTMAPTRIIDDFRLELTLTPPSQTEEDIVRYFVTWLRGIEVADFVPGAGELDAFLQAIRDAFGCADSPPQSPPQFYFDSPPAELRIPKHLVCEWMRAALKLWVTELRPCWQAQCAPKKACACGGPCGCHGTGETPEDMGCDCLLLAAVQITLSGGGGLSDAALDEERRPYLVHLRMLQELLLCGPNCCDGCGDSRTFATVFALDADTLQIWIHHPVALDVPEEAVTLQLGGVTITDFTLTPAASPPGLNLFDLALSGSPVPAIGNASTIEVWFDTTLIQESGGATLASAIWQGGYCYGDYLEPRLRVFASATLVSLDGDVTGPPAQNQLVAIQGKQLNVGGVLNQQVLGFDNGKWHPVPMPQPATATPQPAAGPGNKGTTLLKYALEDHVHPAPPQPVIPQPSTAKPLVDSGSGAPGISLKYSREDHVHPAPKASGDFVEHPPDLPRFLIVAAGIVGGGKTARTPVYNNLVAMAPADGILLIRFDGYQNPLTKLTHQYIVKVLIVFEPRQGKDAPLPLIVAFSKFLGDKEGIELTVRDTTGNPVSKATLVESEFMIEVSQFFGK
jgi:hypothetical protein